MSESYSKKLRDPRWRKLRKKVIKRDGGKCCDCESKNKLHVHHLWYTQEPWDVPMIGLITLCEYCHSVEHQQKILRTKLKEFPFYKAPPPKTPKIDAVIKKIKKKQKKSRSAKLWRGGKIKSPDGKHIFSKQEADRRKNRFRDTKLEDYYRRKAIRDANPPIDI